MNENQTQWGDKMIAQLSKDLRAEFPDLSGLSERNIKYCRQFCQFYTNENGQQSVVQFGQQPVAQIPWGHNILIFSKSSLPSVEEIEEELKKIT